MRCSPTHAADLNPNARHAGTSHTSTKLPVDGGMSVLPIPPVAPWG